MPHPVAFDDADPLLHRVRAIALGFPGAQEKVSHGRPTFFVQRTFAVYGGSQKSPAPREPHVRFDHAVLVKADDEERAALVADARFFVPAYLGPSGWLGLDLDAARVNWAEVAELIDASYRLTAPRTLVRAVEEAETDRTRPPRGRT